MRLRSCQCHFDQMTSARMQVAMNPQNTVFDAKRLIGRKFTDPTVQEDVKHWPFKVVDGPDHKPLIEGESPYLSAYESTCWPLSYP